MIFPPAVIGGDTTAVAVRHRHSAVRDESEFGFPPSPLRDDHFENAFRARPFPSRRSPKPPLLFFTPEDYFKPRMNTNGREFMANHLSAIRVNWFIRGSICAYRR